MSHVILLFFYRERNHEMQVVLGGLDLGKKESFEQTLAVEKTIVHEGYKETSQAVYNDIGKTFIRSMCILVTIPSHIVDT